MLGALICILKLMYLTMRKIKGFQKVLEEIVLIIRK